MTLLGFDRYATYHAGADLGLFTQTLMSAFSQVAPFSNTLEGGNHFTYHFSPILYAFAPFVIAAQSGWPLIVVQALAGAFVAPAMYRIARQRFEERTASLVAFGSLAYPPLVGVTFTDFHEAGLLPAATLWLLDALDTKSFARAAIFAAICLATRDDQGVILGFLGIAAIGYGFRRGATGTMRFGAGLIGASAIVFVGYFALVRPLAGGTDGWHPLHFYAWNATPGESIDVRGRVTYLLEAFAPLAFVPVLAPAVVLALPGFAEVLGSHESLTYTMGQHYPGVWIGFVLFAFVLGLARIAKRAPSLATRYATGSLVVSLLWLAVASPTHWGHFLRLRNAHDAALDRAAASFRYENQVGKRTDVSVGTFDEMYAHLGYDPCAQIGIALRPCWRFPAAQTAQRTPASESARVDYALFDARYDSASWRDVYRPQLAYLLCARATSVRETRRSVVTTDDGVVALRLGSLPDDRTTVRNPDGTPFIACST